MTPTLRCFACAVALYAVCGAVPAADREPQLSPKIEPAIDRGLQFLASSQQPSGSLHGRPESALAITSLGVMAFLSAGHVPDDGRHGMTVRSSLQYVISALPEDGYVGRVDGSRMYGQGIVTLVLAETYGAERDPVRRAAIRRWLPKSVKVILDAQRVRKDAGSAGGWRYEPASGDSDLSLSAWNALALRACNNIGVSVPRESIQAAVQYTLRCYRADSRTFGYQPGTERGVPAMTGVGVLVLCLLDAAEREQVALAADTLAGEKPWDARFPYYGQYYLTSAAFHAGRKSWPAVWATVSERLLATQQEDGGWPQSATNEEPGRTYATAMSVLTLSTPLRLAPTSQR
jgi:hypothetical protein